MYKEEGEKRAFLPDFIQYLTKIGFNVIIEKGYGEKLDRRFEDYKQGNPLIDCGCRKDIFKQDYVLILRSPKQSEFNLIGKNTCLISMLHFPTRPGRVKLLRGLGIDAISLDAIVDDFELRLVENMKAVAWNSMEIAFDEIEKRIPQLIRSDGKPWRVLVLGTGMVGRQVVNAASNFGKITRNIEHMELGGNGVIVTILGRNISSRKDILCELLAKTDILVDSTRRKNPSKPVIPNRWLSSLPKEATIVDLAVDPYILSSDPIVVKGIEGIPHGNLDNYIFEADDERWDHNVPSEIPSKNRRKTISCYSWPGIYPEECMHHYAKQLRPLMRVLREKDYSTLSLDGSYFERALYRARLDSFK